MKTLFLFPVVVLSFIVPAFFERINDKEEFFRGISFTSDGGGWCVIGAGVFVAAIFKLSRLVA